MEETCFNQLVPESHSFSDDSYLIVIGEGQKVRG